MTSTPMATGFHGYARRREGVVVRLFSSQSSGLLKSGGTEWKARVKAVSSGAVHPPASRRASLLRRPPVIRRSSLGLSTSLIRRCHEQAQLLA
ncbi:hypothetical protein MRX96_028357 [Rhipicephalus microplus]